ncbi:MAG: hypothetical protein AB7S97_01710 [Thermoplasmata archaeon]
MPPVAVQTVRVDYPKLWFAAGSAVGAAAMAAMLYLAYDSVELFGRVFWAACALVICVPILLMLVPPMFTCHYVGEKGLRLRMGLLMNTTVPYRYLRGVGDSKVSYGPLTVGIGVKYVPKRKLVFVTSSFKHLVAIRFDGPQQLGSPMKPLVDQVVLNVRDKEGFVALIRDRAGLEG